MKISAKAGVTRFKLENDKGLSDIAYPEQIQNSYMLNKTISVVFCRALLPKTLYLFIFAPFCRRNGDKKRIVFPDLFANTNERFT